MSQTDSVNRSLRLSPTGQIAANRSFQICGVSQSNFVVQLGIENRRSITRQALGRFLKGERVERELFCIFCKSLSLEISSVADYSEQVEPQSTQESIEIQMAVPLAPWWHDDLHPLNFRAFLTEKGRYFVGREWVFEEIEHRCAQGEQAILLTGDPGAGKSAIIAELIRRNPGGGILAYHCCQSDVDQSLRPGRFIRSLAAQIARQIDEYAECLLDPAVEEALRESNGCGSFETTALSRY